MTKGSDTRVWDAIRLEVENAGKLHVKVGVLMSGQGSQTQGGITMVELALIHELGAPSRNIPARSFIRSTFETHAKAEFEVVLGKLARGIVSGKVTASRALDVLGAWSVAQIKNSIAKRLIKQDLRPATIAKKNRTSKNPADATTALVDTGRLINAISYEQSKL